ncbi:hypothetical protein ACVWXQ_001862 [Bradyrhizobium sp. S3.14.4]
MSKSAIKELHDHLEKPGGFFMISTACGKPVSAHDKNGEIDLDVALAALKGGQMSETETTPDYDAMSDEEIALHDHRVGNVGMSKEHRKRMRRGYDDIRKKARGFEASASDRLISLDIQDIQISGERRPLDENTIVSLMRSVERIGLQSPPTVRMIDPDGGGGIPHLVAGRHRLEAMKRLGHLSIVCLIPDVDDADAELIEIAENLHRAELTILQRDEQIARWIELTTVKEECGVSRQPDAKPEATKGGRPEGGVRAAARELNLSEPDARRAMKVAMLSPEAKDAAIEIGLDDNRSALLEAAKQTEPDKQVVVLRDWKQEAKRLKDVNKDLRGKIEARDAVERVDAKLACEHSARAMFAEADKERLQAEVDRLTEENAALRTAKEDSDARYRELWAFVDNDARDAFMAQISREAA